MQREICRAFPPRHTGFSCTRISHSTMQRMSAAYLKALGISHVYCSPYLQAAPGSMHGYDVVDHQRVNEELGGEEGHQRFCARLAELGLGPGARYRSEPHGDRAPQSELVGRSRKWTVESIRHVVRHRLALIGSKASKQGPDTCPRRSIWPRSGCRPDSDRSRRWRPLDSIHR